MEVIFIHFHQIIQQWLFKERASFSADMGGNMVFLPTLCLVMLHGGVFTQKGMIAGMYLQEQL